MSATATDKSPHFPVMLPEVLAALSPKAGEIYLDGTMGAGGYSRAVLSVAGTHLIAVDQDPTTAHTVEALLAEFADRFSFFAGPFSQMEEATAGRKLDGIMLDIGVSSMQIDQAIRGFSFQKPGPLDMRMSRSGPSAADAVALLSGKEMTDIFKAYGEERRAKRCADFIVSAREEEPIETTDRLASVIERALGRSGKIHPATRVFQALRIFINDELGELHRALHAAERILKVGGRLVVVTFHSLEDRIVKAFLRRRTGEVAGGSRHLPPGAVQTRPASFELPFRKTQTASKDELAQNVRSRSAKLRCGIRLDATVWPEDDFEFSYLPTLDDLARRMS